MKVSAKSARRVRTASFVPENDFRVDNSSEELGRKNFRLARKIFRLAWRKRK